MTYANANVNQIYKETNTPEQNKELAISFFNGNNNNFGGFQGLKNAQHGVTVCEFLYNLKPKSTSEAGIASICACCGGIEYDDFLSDLIMCFTRYDKTEDIMDSMALSGYLKGAITCDDEIIQKAKAKKIKVCELIEKHRANCPKGPAVYHTYERNSKGEWYPAAVGTTTFLSEKKYNWIKDFSEKQVKPALAKMK